MSVTVAQMSKEDLQEMIETVLEKKLLEIFYDPDEKLELRESIRDRLLRQRKDIEAGERGDSFEDVKRELGLV